MERTVARAELLAMVRDARARWDALLSEDDLNEAGHFRDMPADWRPWRVLYDPHHYDAHAADIAAWLEASRDG